MQCETTSSDGVSGKIENVAKVDKAQFDNLRLVVPQSPGHHPRSAQELGQWGKHGSQNQLCCSESESQRKVSSAPEFPPIGTISKSTGIHHPHPTSSEADNHNKVRTKYLAYLANQTVQKIYALSKILKGLFHLCKVCTTSISMQNDHFNVYFERGGGGLADE